MTISPLAPPPLKTLPVVDGVRYSAVQAGVRYPNRLDLMLMEFAAGSVLAGVFTKSATRSAPVLNSEAILGKEGEAGFAILANSGNSNAFTGQAGFDACARCLASLEGKLNLSKTSVHMASTGVIGEVLPDRRITAALDPLIEGLDAGRAIEAAQAVMTTDTFAKGASRVFEIDGKTVTISGFAKGSGMIAPDMATMLGFLATDINIARPLLQQALSDTTKTSFNAITVDSDTSTSDCVYLGATCRADIAPITDLNDPRYAVFKEQLHEVMTELAHLIVRDGEGARKFVEIRITGAASDASAKIQAMAIANSPLVKTAIAGEDPNWGRIVMAIGKAGEPADRDKIRIKIGGVLVAENGGVHHNYVEADAALHMKQSEILIEVDLGLGEGHFTAWTCDFTARYIEINADYRS